MTKNNFHGGWCNFDFIVFNRMTDGKL